MIRILKIDPMDRKSKFCSVADLEKEFISRLRKDLQPENLLHQFIINKQSRQYNASVRELSVLRYLKRKFPKVILGKPKQLALIIKEFEMRKWERLLYNGKSSTPFGVELLHIFGYSQRFRDQIKRGIWLAQQLNIKSCPYCNAQSTIIATSSKAKAIAKFQFDHFFSKAQYPYLSISLYNLVPSCANCNITKSSRLLNLQNHYHPYLTDLSLYFSFHLKYNPDPAKLSLSEVKKQNLEVEIISKFPKSKKMVEVHNELYHISGVYNRHQDVAEELLTKAIIYTQHLIAGHLKIRGLFPDRSTYLRYLIGTYPTPDEILKRPLAKFTQDIAKQLKLY